MSDKDIFNELSREEWENAIYNWVHNELDRKMLIRRHLDGLSVLETAEQFNFSYKQCYKRITAAKKQLFKHIKVVDDDVVII